MQVKKKILAVDDDANNIALVEELLGDDYDLRIATTGKEALEIAVDFHPDIVLLDIMMPGMNGYEVCRRLREHRTLRYTKIIMVSAKATVSERLEGYKAGADDYVTKPFDPDELQAKIHIYLRLKHADELEQMRREFTLKVMHELRTPMAVIKNVISDASANVLGRINPRLHRQLETAGEHMDRLARIISNFFDISKIDAGKIELRLTLFSIRSVVLDVVNLLGTKASLREVDLNTDLPAEELLIIADRKKIIKILTHLIGNAIEFIQEGGSVNVRVEELRDRIRVEVEDNGPGIESDKINDIFNRFIRNERYNFPGERGPGLGLAIAKGLVELHGGRIWAENRPEGGAVFSFEIPISSEVKAAAEPALIGADREA